MHAFEKMYGAYADILFMGYPVPLLYRWKNYEPAKAYWLRGLGLHAVLLQVFKAMKDGKATHIEEIIGKAGAGQTLAAENAERQSKACQG